MEAEADRERDNRKGKEKVEETDQQTVPEIVNNTKLGDVCYLKLIGQHRWNKAVDTDSSAEGLQKRLFRIRRKEIPSILGVEDEKLRNIHSASGATIGIISDPAISIHSHSYLELLGTPDQVTIAELLIIDAITEKYNNLKGPTALMPPDVCHHRMPIPLGKVMSVLGIEGKNVLKLEILSRAWIEINTFHLPVDDKTGEAIVDIHGQKLEVTNAIKMIKNVISGDMEFVKSEYNWEERIIKMAFDEEDEDQESAMLEDEKQKDVEEDGSGEKAAHQNVEETKDKDPGELGSASQPAEEAK